MVSGWGFSPLWGGVSPWGGGGGGLHSVYWGGGYTQKRGFITPFGFGVINGGTNTNTHPHPQIYPRAHSHTCTYTHTHTHGHTRAHTHTRTDTPLLVGITKIAGIPADKDGNAWAHAHFPPRHNSWDELPFSAGVPIGIWIFSYE